MGRFAMSKMVLERLLFASRLPMRFPAPSRMAETMYPPESILAMAARFGLKVVEVIRFKGSICATGKFLPSKTVELRLFKASTWHTGLEARSHTVLFRKFRGFWLAIWREFTSKIEVVQQPSWSIASIRLSALSHTVLEVKFSGLTTAIGRPFASRTFVQMAPRAFWLPISCEAAFQIVVARLFKLSM